MCVYVWKCISPKARVELLLARLTVHPSFILLLHSYSPNDSVQWLLEQPEQDKEQRPSKRETKKKKYKVKKEVERTTGRLTRST